MRLIAVLALGACLAATASTAQQPAVQPQVPVLTPIAPSPIPAQTPAPAATPAPNHAVPEKVTSTCVVCHGLSGDSPAADIPRLNGQQSLYLQQRLKSFLYPGSQDPHATAAMWAVISTVDDATLAAVAEYYAGQPATVADPHGALAALGRKIYENGDLSERVPACQSCHGAKGEGHDNVPRLAGQHRLYLQNQLQRIRLALRATEPMHANTANLSDEQISALIAYLGRD